MTNNKIINKGEVSYFDIYGAAITCGVGIGGFLGGIHGFIYPFGEIKPVDRNPYARSWGAFVGCGMGAFAGGISVALFPIAIPIFAYDYISKRNADK